MDAGAVVPGYSLQFYEALVALANKEEVQGQEYLVYRGGITKVFDELKFSRAHYTRIVKTLEEIGAIEIIQRGNPRQQSVVALYGTPNLESLGEAYHLTSPSGRRKMGADALDVRVTVIERRLGKELDYVKALSNIESRLQALEKKVG
jgi:hypothetical protein